MPWRIPRGYAESRSFETAVHSLRPQTRFHASGQLVSRHIQRGGKQQKKTRVAHGSALAGFLARSRRYHNIALW